MAETKKSGAFFTQGWIQVVIAFVVAIVTQGFGLYSFSILKVPMTEALGAQPAEVALGFSIYALAAGFASLIVGDVINKIKLRGSMLCSAVLFSGGFLILGFMTELWQVYVAYIVMGIGSALGGMVILSGIPNNWFNKRRGIAVAIVWSAMFPGSLIVGQLVPAAVAGGNWQTAPMVLAGIAFVVLVAGAFLLRWQPQEVGLLPDGMTAEEAAAQAETAGAAKLVGLTRGEALKTSTFWFIAIAFALIGIGEQGPFQNFPTYIVGNGFDLAVAGSFMTVISLSGVFGKLASGVIIDFVGPRIAYCILNSLAVIGLVLIIFVGDNIVLLFASSILFGVALSSSAVCFSSATAMYLGPKHFGAIYGIVFLGKPICDAIGVPLVAAVSGTALGFSGAFGICACFVAASTVCMFMVRKNKKLVAMEEEAAREPPGATGRLVGREGGKEAPRRRAAGRLGGKEGCEGSFGPRWPAAQDGTAGGAAGRPARQRAAEWAGGAAGRPRSFEAEPGAFSPGSACGGARMAPLDARREERGMEAVYAGVPWALSTMFSLTGAGAFMAMAVLADAFPAEGRRLASIDALSLMPSLAVVLGCVAAYFALQDETAAAFLLRGVDGAARYAAVGAAGAFAVAALAYGAVAVSGRMPSRLRKPLLRTVGLLGLLFVCALAAAHVLAGDPVWATAATPAQMLGCALLGGSALAALLFENAGALEGRGAKGVLAAFAAAGAVLGLGGLAAHVAMVLGTAGAAGVELVRAASTHVAVGALCLAATLVFTLMALRLKETGYHVVIAVACAFVGTFCVRLAFYALQVSAL